ncbi:MAG: metallophosphoesterase [Magnetococcus sp. DMHC-1]|nr:metallophosphoesterase [Magnetococcales bacterium]
MERFRIFHLSDLHLADIANRLNLISSGLDIWSGGWRYLASVLGLDERGSVSLGKPSTFDGHLAQRLTYLLQSLVNEAKRERVASAILITGDLAATGLESDMQAARRYITGAGPVAEGYRTWPGLTTHGVPLLFMPGNHDRYQRLFMPGSTEFENQFGNDWSFGQGIWKMGGKMRYALLEGVKERLAFLACDLTLDPNDEDLLLADWPGKGKVYPDSLQSMRDFTELVRDHFSPSVILWVTHFPPFFANLDDNLRLLDAEFLVQAAEDLAIDVVFSGHTHEFGPNNGIKTGQVNWITVGTACCVERDDLPGLLVVDLVVENGRLLHNQCIVRPVSVDSGLFIP